MREVELVLQGQALIAADRLEEALAVYNELLMIQPLMPLGFTGRAMIMRALGNHAEAVLAYERGIVMAPNDPNLSRMDLGALWYELADSLLALERLEDALQAFDTALAFDPALVDALGARGVTLARLGRSEEAIAAYEETLAHAPGEPIIWFNKGEMEFLLGRHDDAQKSYYRFAVILKANGPGELTELLPKAIARMSAIVEARKKAPEVQPPTPAPPPAARPAPAAWQRYGAEAHEHYKAGRFDEAERLLRQAVAEAPAGQKAQLLHNLGQTLAYMGKLKEAATCYLDAVEADENQSHSWLHLGVTFMKMQRPTQALEALKHAVAQQPGKADGWFWQSQALAQAGHAAEALAAGERAMALAPADEAIRTHVARLLEHLPRG